MRIVKTVAKLKREKVERRSRRSRFTG